MRTLITLLVLLAGACTGSSPASIDSGRLCSGQLYDRCLQEHDCASMDCRNFMAEGFEVCSKSCTVGDDSTCGKTLDGRQATCDALGICKPPGPNECVLSR
jgi:hypothetical protein